MGMKEIIVVLIGYLIGSINSSIIVGRLLKNVDIRTMGSGNAGATNTLRSLGKGPAALVVLGDALKGIISVVIGGLVTGTQTGALLGGFFAIVGHNWPLYFNFKGGKGILTSAVVVIMVTPQIGFAVVAFALIIMAITRYVSLGSMLGAILYPILVITFEFKNGDLIIFAVVIAILAIYRHKSNILRLRDGTESKLGEKKK